MDHYLEYDRNYSRTVGMLGYPNRVTLRSGCEELAPEARKLRRSAINYSQEQKKGAVIELFRRKTSTKKITEQMSVSRKTLYNWKSELVEREFPLTMPIQSTNYEEVELKVEIEDLKKQIYQLKWKKKY